MENTNVLGEKLYGLIQKLYPICRSITGEGVRETLKLLQEVIPLEIHEVASGTQVFDWTVPREWNIRDAYIKTLDGQKIVDFKKLNLHILNYSAPFQGVVSINELKNHLFTLPDYPDWVPYRTSYHQENWGFCLSHHQLQKMQDQEYEVLIDSEIKDGYLTYGELYIPGRTGKEVLISCHVCHPSLCNDNLSGISVAAHLAKSLLDSPEQEYSYRFLFIPATIGAITWLFYNQDKVANIKFGLVATLLGDKGKFHYKKSRNDDYEINRIVPYALKNTGAPFEIIDFFPYGYDERQYCSPGFDLPVGCLMRTPHGEFPEYHTSADNLDFVRPECLEESFRVFQKIFEIIENNNTYINLLPKCEPQLGKRGLYQQISGDSHSSAKDQQMAILWLLNMSDGKNDLLKIAEKSGIAFSTLKRMADLLVQNNLLKKK